MPTTLAEVGETLREIFPMSGGSYMLDLASDPPMDARGVVTIRLIVWEGEDAAGARTVRDLKEQEVFLLDPALLAGDTPVQACLRGWAEAVCLVLEKAKPGVVDRLLPDDLAPGDAILLRRAQTPADYREALLKKSRLGKWIDAP